MNAAKQPPGALGGGGSLPAAAVPIKKEEEVDTDDELCSQPTGRGHCQHVLKKEEDVDTDDELQNTDDTPQANNAAEKTAAQDISGQGKQKRVVKTFEARLQELTAYKAKHGHANVKKSEDKSLAQFCADIRRSRRGTGATKLTITEERIASLDALGFNWAPKRGGNKDKSFLNRVEELKAYKAKHGHLKVSESEDKSLYQFCRDMRYARGNPESRKGRKLTVERIASLDALGFDWAGSRTSPKSFEERIEDLKAYKVEHGHLDVTWSEDNRLYNFCSHIRSARRGTGTIKLDDGRIASLNELGFDWRMRQSTKNNENVKPKPFQARLEELKAYKAKYGHLKVKESEDKRLCQFCVDIRRARSSPGRPGTMKLSEGRIASLDAIGFVWEPKRHNAFEEKLEELAAYKVEHGHLDVKKSEDKSLYRFCNSIRGSRRNPEKNGGIKATEERIAALNALGFDWTPSEKVKSFRERIEELKAYKAEHGHLNMKKSDDKSLYNFFYAIRRARKGLGKTKLDDERIASLDALGFVWAPSEKVKSFQERIKELKAHKAKHGHVNVEKSEDKSLAIFCMDTRRAHRGKGNRKLTEERIAALDAIGFDWAPGKGNKWKSSERSSVAFEKRLEELKAYKAKHGHVHVKQSEDKSLAGFCCDMRHARRNPESRKGRKLTEERIASLDALEFDWKMQQSKEAAQRKKAEAEVAARR